MQRIKNWLCFITPVQRNIILISWFSVCALSLAAQDEKVTFDMDKGEFNVKRIPYIHPITITGVATKEGQEIDVIRLTITKDTDNDLTKLHANLYRQQQLSEAIKQDENQITALTSAALKTTLKELTDELKGLDDLVSEIEKLTAPEVEKLAKSKVKIDSLLKRIPGELSTKKNEKIKLDNDILELETKIAENQFYDNVWKRDGTAKEFNFSLGKRLDMAATYTFSFTLYQTNTSTFPIDKLLAPIQDDLEKVLKDVGFISEDDLTQKVTGVLDQINKEVFSKTIAINPNGTISPKGLQISSEKREELSKSIGDYYAAIANLNEAKKQLSDNINALKKLVDDNVILPASRLGDLKKMIDVEAQYNSTGFNSAIPASIATDIKNQLDLRYRNLPDQRGIVQSREGDQKKNLATIKTAFDFVKSLYVEKGNVTQAGNTSASETTDVVGIRISTIYSLGVTPLEDDFGSIEWFQFVAVNIRWADFDNRRPGKLAYVHPFFSRCAVTIGMVTSSDMQYRGQRLDNPRIGFKPVIGLSFEPLQHLNLSAGIISFTPSAIGNSQNDPKVRPYFSVAFDFNLFNFLIQKQ